jgi:hypothetical protein
VQKSLETKEKLHSTYQTKIASLLNDKQELTDKLEEIKNKEIELTKTIELNQGNISKKDKIYAKMLKIKDRKIHKLTNSMKIFK